jgi:uncharacterized membrane protein
MFKPQCISDAVAKNPNKWRWVAVGVIIVLALVLRIWGLGSESAWIDEAYSIALAKHSILDILKGTAADQHPPLYYLLLHFWLLMGSGVAYARLLSLLIGMILVIQTLHLGRGMGGDVIGLGAGLLLAVSPMHVWYSQEARMYILLASLTTAATAALWSCLHGRSRWVIYGLYSVLALYTQYFAVFVFLAHAAIVVAWVWIKRDRQILFHWGIAMFCVGLSFLPWLPTALYQTKYHTMSWIASPHVNDVRDTLVRLLYGVSIFAFSDILRWVGTGILGILFAWAVTRFRLQGNEKQWGFGFLAAWAWIPFIAITVVSVAYPVFQFKQFLIVLVPILLWSVWAARNLPRLWGVALFASLLILASVSVIYQQVTLSKDDWRGAAIYIQDHAEPGDIVYGNPAASFDALLLYWTRPLPFDGYPPNYDIVQGGWDNAMLTPELAGRLLTAATSGHQRTWLVEYSPEFRDPQKTLEAWLGQHARLVDDQYNGKIHTRLYQLQDHNP